MRRLLVGVLAVAVAAGAVFGTVVLLRPYARAVSFVVRSAGQQRTYPRLAAWHTQPHTETDLSVPTRDGPARARVYRPARRTGRAVLAVPGVHARSIDEPRMVAFARALAASGLLVVTPEIADLKAYLVTPRATDAIEDAARWLVGQHELTGGRKIGLMGISFAGGLSIAASSRASIRDQLAFVFSFGGHGDFQRVMRYLCTGLEEPVRDGSWDEGAERSSLEVRAPHDYGLAVIALDLAHLLVPEEQVAPLRTGILTFLEASHLALYDKAAADREFARAARMEEGLAEPSRSVLHHVNTRDVKELGRLLLPHTLELGDDPSLSPEKSPPPRAPVFLIHGADDNVVPASETVRLAAYLHGTTPVRWLLSPLITHAEVGREAKAGEILALVRFWAALLRA